MTMSPFIEKMIQSRQLNFEEGRFEMMGLRGVILPSKTMIYLLEDIYQQLGEDAFEILFHTGLEHGKTAIESVARENGVTKQEFFSQLIESANIMGLGEMKVETFDLEEMVIEVSLTDSPFVEEIEDSESFEELQRPVDDLVRGMFHGIAEGLFDSDVRSEETRCAYIDGSDSCRIVVRGE